MYPIGGSQRIARKTVDMIEREGGEVRVGQEVQSIMVEVGRSVGVAVKDLASGRSYQVRAKAVVSSAGARNTYGRLLNSQQVDGVAQSLDDLGTTISAIVLFVGFKASPADLGFDGANYWTFKDGDHEAAAQAAPGEGPLYFSFASLKNPAARSHVAEIVSLCDLAHFEPWADLPLPHDEASYQALKTRVTTRMIDRAEALFPGFKDRVAYTELATPLTFRTYQNSIDGAFYGLPASPDRLRSRYAVPRTPIKGLYLSGQDALIPGIIGAAAGGARCAAIMLGMDRTPKVFKTILKEAKTKPAGPWNGYLQVSRIVQETPTVRSLYLEAPDDHALPFSWTAGQYLNVYVPTPEAKTIRSYSISSADGQWDGRQVRLTIKKEPHGKASSFVHDHIVPGDLLEVAGPHGEFTFTSGDAPRLLLLGGGVGVTPLMAALEHLHQTGTDIPVTAIFAFRSSDEIVFHDRLRELKVAMPKLSLSLVLSKADADWSGPTGRITPDLIRKVCPDVANCRAHICGPVPMMEAMSEALASLGVPSGEIRTESFGAVAPKPKAAHGTEFTIRFKASGKEAKGVVGDTILDVALREKVVIPHACGVGTCGTCRMRVLQGDYDAAPTDMLRPKEVEQGFVLACRTRPQTDIEIDV